MPTHHFLTLRVKLSQAPESLLLYLMPPTRVANDSSYGSTQAIRKKTGARRPRCAKRREKGCSSLPKSHWRGVHNPLPPFKTVACTNCPNRLHEQFRYRVSVAGANLSWCGACQHTELRNTLPLVPASHEPGGTRGEYFCLSAAH